MLNDMLKIRQCWAACLGVEPETNKAKTVELTFDFHSQHTDIHRVKVTFCDFHALMRMPFHLSTFACKCGLKHAWNPLHDNYSSHFCHLTMRQVWGQVPTCISSCNPHNASVE